MPTLPAYFTVSDTRLVFLKQYKYLGIYSISQGAIIATFALTTARKLSISDATGELKVENGSTSNLFKSSYTMDTNGYMTMDNSSIIIGTGDPSNQITITAYPLNDPDACPDVVIKSDNTNKVCVFSKCGDATCSVANTTCQVITACDDSANYA